MFVTWLIVLVTATIVGAAQRPPQLTEGSDLATYVSVSRQSIFCKRIYTYGR